jgi:uncharacterized membrane protein YgaE (UPF0421/DUF939 family)
VIAAFITFMGANNSGEQIRKALFRVAGTLVGITVGSLLANAVGHSTGWSITVILVSLFFGFYLMRINYAFMVVGITVMVSQLYVQLDEFSNSFLLLRLEETAIGAAVAIGVVLVVVPLRTRRVLRVALRTHVQAVAVLVEHATDHLLTENPGIVSTLRADARAIDACYHALIATAQPLRRNLFGSIDEDIGQVVRLASAARNYSRNLVTDISTAERSVDEQPDDLRRAGTTLLRSLQVTADALTGPRDTPYTRSSALFDRTERHLEARGPGTLAGQLAIRDLTLIDGAMAAFAQTLGLPITDHDTVQIGRTTPSPATGEPPPATA